MKLNIILYTLYILAMGAPYIDAIPNNCTIHSYRISESDQNSEILPYRIPIWNPLQIPKLCGQYENLYNGNTQFIQILYYFISHIASWSTHIINYLTCQPDQSIYYQIYSNNYNLTSQTLSDTYKSLIVSTSKSYHRKISRQCI